MIKLQEHRKVLPARPVADLRPAPRQRGNQAGRLRLDHGAVGRRQEHAAAHPRHARQRLDRRVLAARRSDSPAVGEGPDAAAEAAHRLRVPELSPARQPDGLREHRPAAVVSRRQEGGARRHGRRHPRPLQHRRQEGSVPEPALGRPAAAGRDRPRGGRQADADPRRRADRQPALRSGQGDHGAVPPPERGRHDDRPGHALEGERVVRQARDQSEGRLDRR